MRPKQKVAQASYSKSWSLDASFVHGLVRSKSSLTNTSGPLLIGYYPTGLDISIEHRLPVEDDRSVLEH